MKRTAILIFACSAREESTHKKLSADAGENYRIFQELNNKITDLAESTSLPYFIFDEDRQQGILYGSRITNALAAIYNYGYDSAIIVFNNCANLTLDHIHNAGAELEHTSLVIGPDNYGGAYLIGIDKNIFNRNTFSHLHWETNLLFHDLKCYAPSRKLLPRLRVLNGIHSIRMQHFSSWISGAIKRLMYTPDGFSNSHGSAFAKEQMPQGHGSS
jgi:hypothetical protein